MKILIFSLFALLATIEGESQKVHTSNISINIIDCETSVIWRLRNDSLLVESNYDVPVGQSKFVLQVKLTNKDLKRLDSAFAKLIYPPGGEVLVNECVDDGFNFKMYLNNGYNKKKIFVGNYYDSRVDSLTRIINSYVSKSNLYLGNYGIGCGDPGDIKRQNACDIPLSDLNKEIYLNRWCEMPDK